MALLVDLKQANLWVYTTLKDCLSSLKNFKNVHSSWKIGCIKLTSSSITSKCCSWRLLFLDSTICFIFKHCFGLVHKNDVPILLLGFNPFNMCSFFEHLQTFVWLKPSSISTTCTYSATYYHSNLMICRYYAMWIVGVFQETMIICCCKSNLSIHAHQICN